MLRSSGFSNRNVTDLVTNTEPYKKGNVTNKLTPQPPVLQMNCNTFFMSNVTESNWILSSILYQRCLAYVNRLSLNSPKHKKNEVARRFWKSFVKKRNKNHRKKFVCWGSLELVIWHCRQINGSARGKTTSKSEEEEAISRCCRGPDRNQLLRSKEVRLLREMEKMFSQWEGWQLLDFLVSTIAFEG